MNSHHMEPTKLFFQTKGKKRHRTDKTTKPGTKKTKQDGKEKEKDKGKQKKTGNSKSEGALSKRRKGN